MNYFPFHVGDWMADTAHLTPLEDCAYRRMLDRYYLDEGPLPTSTEGVARLIRMREEEAVVEAVLREFFDLQDDGWHHSRCDEEIAKYQAKAEKARASAAIGVSARRDRTNAQLRAQRMSEARAKCQHTKAEWLALREFCGQKCVRCGAGGHLDRDHIVPVYQGGSDGIDNIQPLCAKCNASKGPEAVDHRPAGWRAFVERSLSVRSAFAQLTKNQEPITNNQEPEERPRKRGTRLPDDWQPSEEEIRYARQKNLDPGKVAERFRNHWLAVPGQRGVKLDWTATWRNWCLKDADTLPRKPADKPPPSQAEVEATRRQIAAESAAQAVRLKLPSLRQ